MRASDAEEALRMIGEHRPSLILLDLALPGMDGLTLTRKLKADPETRGITVVALTAFAMKGDEEKARKAGCDGYITKPIDTRALPTLVAGYLPESPARSPKACFKFLVVEDTASELKLIQHVLIGAGHQVDGAEAAQKAIETVKLNQPHVILLDLLLPGMDGLRLARLLKADPEIRHIPILALTSYTEFFYEADARAAGCDGFLTKPIDVRSLPEMLENFLKKYQAK
jgi:two-component system cell cycle response regulator